MNTLHTDGRESSQGRELHGHMLDGTFLHDVHIMGPFANYMVILHSDTRWMTDTIIFYFDAIYPLSPTPRLSK